MPATQAAHARRAVILMAAADDAPVLDAQTCAGSSPDDDGACDGPGAAAAPSVARRAQRAEAVGSFMQALLLDRSSLGIHLNLLVGAILWEGRRPAAAQRAMSELLAVRPPPPDLWAATAKYGMMAGAPPPQRAVAAASLRSQLSGARGVAATLDEGAGEVCGPCLDLVAHWFKYGSGCGELGWHLNHKVRLHRALAAAAVLDKTDPERRLWSILRRAK